MSFPEPPPPPPRSSASSGNGKRLHSQMALATSSQAPLAIQPQQALPPPDGHINTKKPKLSHKSHTSSSKKASQEAANTAGWMNIQSSINRLTDSVTTSFTVTDESCATDDRSHALQNMQQEEGLSTDERVSLIHVFMTNPTACNTYLNITLPELRLPFLKSMIPKNSETQMTS
ncbi:hypothetical protein M405DRAFT_865958 [Rhizopogon salebrosus TDB-379]|nr:hypothetical protein M405DRAFT_865958 [Rhizopogon salebrosus TDB-379]